MHDGKLMRIPEPLERLEPRGEAEEDIEIDDGVVAGAWARDGDARPRLVVVGFSERHDDVQAVDGSALKNRDELFGAPRLSLRERGSHQERRGEAEADERERAVL